MLSDVVLLVARLLMSAMFFAGGWSKLRGDPGERQAIAGLGLPMPGALERLTGFCLIAGAAALVLGIYVRSAAILLAVFVVVVTPLFLRFWTVQDPQQRAQLGQAFFGNVAIIGGLLAVVAAGPGALSLMPAT